MQVYKHTTEKKLLKKIQSQINLMREVILSLGSSIGNRIQSFHEALRRLKKFGTISDTSFLYKTDPMYNTDQEFFLNAVISYKTSLSPLGLLQRIKDIESGLGRTDSMKQVWKGPRPIDIDILFYENEVMDTEILSIPHKLIQERDFVLKPLNDIVPKLKHPVFHKTIEDLYIENEKYGKFHSNPHRVTSINNRLTNQEKIFDFTKMTGKMGILNCTTDSINKHKHITHINYTELIDDYSFYSSENFEIVDIGGESTRPNSEAISSHEEINRISPLLEKLVNVANPILVSIDTKKADVAEAAICIRGDIINDVSGGTHDGQIFEAASKHDMPIVIMHNRGNSREMLSRNQYKNMVEDVSSEVSSQIQQAKVKGIYRWNILIDPGVGFAKRRDQNMDLIQNLPKLSEKLEYPVVVGFSQKKFIHEISKGEPIYGDAVMCGICVQKGASILRVHDPKLSRSIDFADRVYKNKTIFFQDM